MKCHVANFATFVSKTLIFSSQKMDEFNLKFNLILDCKTKQET